MAPVEQPPQSDTLVCSSTHALPHAVYGVVHAIPQMPTPAAGAHVAVPFAGVGHTVLHAPQFVGSVVKLTHLSPSHALNPLVHVKPHALSVHVAVPFAGAVHAYPFVLVVHPPQSAVLDERFTHMSSHSVSPAAQPLVHANVAPLAAQYGSAASHVWPQVPQFAAVEVGVSQPPETAPVQWAYPAPHVSTAHSPFASHVAVAFGREQGEQLVAAQP